MQTDETWQAGNGRGPQRTGAHTALSVALCGWVVCAGSFACATLVACTSAPPAAAPAPAPGVVGQADSPLAPRARPAFSSERAWADLEALSRIGPRPSGSEGNRQAREYLRASLAPFATEVREQTFVVELPDTGRSVELVSLTAVLEGTSPDVVMLAAHYDTAEFHDFEFVGTNDGASGPALLLELGRALAGREWPYTVWLTFIDGDALRVGGETAHSGSRALAQWLAEQGVFERIRLAVFFNQVCDAELDIARDLHSHPIHRRVFWESAEDLGYTSAFASDGYFDSPDAGHVAFVEAGLRRVVALVDDHFGGDEPPGIYWHTEEDTLARCAAGSLQAVGAVTSEALDRIAGRLQRIDAVAWSPPAPEPPAGDAAGPEGTPPNALSESGVVLSPGAPAGTNAP